MKKITKARIRNILDSYSFADRLNLCLNYDYYTKKYYIMILYNNYINYIEDEDEIYSTGKFWNGFGTKKAKEELISTIASEMKSALFECSSFENSKTDYITSKELIKYLNKNYSKLLEGLKKEEIKFIADEIQKRTSYWLDSYEIDEKLHNEIIEIKTSADFRDKFTKTLEDIAFK